MRRDRDVDLYLSVSYVHVPARCEKRGQLPSLVRIQMYVRDVSLSVAVEPRLYRDCKCFRCPKRAVAHSFLKPPQATTPVPHNTFIPARIFTPPTLLPLCCLALRPLSHTTARALAGSRMTERRTLARICPTFAVGSNHHCSRIDEMFCVSIASLR